MKRRTFFITSFSLLFIKLIPFNAHFLYPGKKDIYIPDDLYYTKDHTWLKVEGDVGTIGITDYAQQELGEIIYIDFECKKENNIDKGNSFGTIEAVKTVAAVFCPVSGKISDINLSLNDNPHIINKDPYHKGWMLKLKLFDLNELKGLLDAKAYKKLINE